MALPSLKFTTKQQACEFMRQALSGSELEDKAVSVAKTVEKYLDKYYSDLPDTEIEREALKDQEPKAEKFKAEYVVLKVDDEQAYVFTTCLAIRKPVTDLDAVFAPHEIGLEEVPVRLQAYIEWERICNKRAAAFANLGDFMECGSKKRLKEFGLTLKTKLPCWMCSAPPKHVILRITPDSEPIDS